MGEPVSAPWPWPQDNTEAKLRRIGLMYRDELHRANEKACDQLDHNMSCWGETWVTDDDVIDVNALLTKGQIEARFGIRPHQVRDWSQRFPDKLPPRGMRGRAKLYRLGDVLSLAGRNKTVGSQQENGRP